MWNVWNSFSYLNHFLILRIKTWFLTNMILQVIYTVQVISLSSTHCCRLWLGQRELDKTVKSSKAFQQMSGRQQRRVSISCRWQQRPRCWLLRLLVKVTADYKKNFFSWKPINLRFEEIPIRCKAEFCVGGPPEESYQKFPKISFVWYLSLISEDFFFFFEFFEHGIISRRMGAILSAVF